MVILASSFFRYGETVIPKASERQFPTIPTSLIFSSVYVLVKDLSSSLTFFAYISTHCKCFAVIIMGIHFPQHSALLPTPHYNTSIVCLRRVPVIPTCITFMQNDLFPPQSTRIQRGPHSSTCLSLITGRLPQDYRYSSLPTPLWRWVFLFPRGKMFMHCFVKRNVTGKRIRVVMCVVGLAIYF